MDNADREKAFARCSQRWDAARNFRRFRTAQQDQAARATETRRLYLAVAIGLTVAAIPTVITLAATDRSVFLTVALGLLTWAWAQWAAFSLMNAAAQRRQEPER